MSRLTISEAKNLMEAYQSVYAPQETLSTLEQEIFESIAYTLISQGYNAVDVLEYFANVDGEVIVEDIIALSEGNLLIESVVSEEYIQEQYEILNEALPAVAAGLSLAGRALLGQGARRAAGAVVKRMAGPGVRKAVKSLGSNLGKVKGALGGAVNKLKGATRGALDKLPGGSKGKIASALKTAGKWALGGAGFEAGMRGTSALLDKVGQKKSQSTPAKTTPSKAPTAPSPKPSSSAPAPAPRSSAPVSPKTKPSKPFVKQTGDKAKDMETWAKANPTLAAKLKPSGQSTASDVEDIKRMQNRSKQRQGVEMGGPEGPGKIDPKSVESDIKAAQEREKKKASSTTKSESYDAYDVVLEYLFSTGHVDTLEEAHYVMMEMDSESIQSIVEAYGSIGANMAGAELQRRQTEKVRQQEREKIEQEKQSATSKLKGA